MKRASLLAFAIAASVAVVPILLAVLLAVAWWRPLDPAFRPSRAADHHVSVREVAALKTFEQAIVPRDRVMAKASNGAALVAGIPSCRDEWEGRSGAVDRLRRWLSPATGSGASQADRIAAQLTALDAALATFSTASNRRVSEAVGFDLARWMAAVSLALRTPVEAPDYPDVKFTVQCADIAGAVTMLTRGNARMLDALAWRGTEVARVVARWRPDQVVEFAPRNIARGNPWAGVPGCIYLGTADAPTHFVAESRGVAERLCTRPVMLAAQDDAAAPIAIVGEPAPDMAPDDARWSVPPSLFAMLQSLAPLHRATGSMHTPAKVRVDGMPVEVGASIDVTIDPALQALAQKTAACYTGRQDICAALGISRKEDEGKAIGHRLLEQAMVRMAAVAIVDVASGRIEALAGALSPCTRDEYDGPGREAHCDKRLPYPVRYRPDALLNQAVYHDAMPASVVKPILASAFLADPVVGARWLAAERTEMTHTPWPTRDSLRGQLMRSDSARFLDRMFCAEQNFAHCDRPWRVQAAAAAFGWNNACDAAREDCGKRDLLLGGALADRGLDTIVPYGRLLVAPASDALGAPMRLRPAVALDPAKVLACAAGPDGRRFSKDDWDKCRGRIVVDVVADGWGQGNARSSALGVAGMMASVAATANGEPVRAPHLVQSMRSVSDERGSQTIVAFAAAAPNAAGISREAAEVILSGLSYSHRGGTARLACEQVFAPRTCHDMDWIAGKTGTPTFPNDDVTLDQLARLCAPNVTRTRREAAMCGALRPYKWYVAAYRIDPAQPRWSKVVAVLTERNWIADSGRIHGAGDVGPNPAAEIAMQIAGRHAGYLAGGAQ